MNTNTHLVYESIYGYIRVSTLEQAKHGTSIKEQKKVITKMSQYPPDRDWETKCVLVFICCKTPQ